MINSYGKIQTLTTKELSLYNKIHVESLNSVPLFLTKRYPGEDLPLSYLPHMHLLANQIPITRYLLDNMKTKHSLDVIKT